MDRAKLLEVVRAEFHKHSFGYYAESVPNSNRKNTVPGCPYCKVRLQTVSQFVDHLEEKVIAAIERESSRSNACQVPFAMNKISLPQH
jgi:hypothetical protein